MCRKEIALRIGDFPGNWVRGDWWLDGESVCQGAFPISEVPVFMFLTKHEAILKMLIPYVIIEQH